MLKKYYVTTPLYYGTGRPHLGSLYSTLLADVSTRWHKLKGYETFFLTGTDEHGQKIAESAAKAGKKPKEFVDVFVAEYKKTWKDYRIDYTKFIRTTDDEHKEAVINTVACLPEIYKTVLILYYFEELQIQEISNILDCPKKTIETRLYRAKGILKSMLKQELSGGELYELQNL